MATVKIKLVGDGYHSENSENEELELIGLLLGENVFDMVDYLREGLANYGGVDYTTAAFDKIDDEIELTCLISDDPENRYSFRMPYDKFMKMIDQWEVAFAGCPDEVIIHMDDDYNFTFERITKEGWTLGQMGPQ